jgi:hypothetical protein
MFISVGKTKCCLILSPPVLGGRKWEDRAYGCLVVWLVWDLGMLGGSCLAFPIFSVNFVRKAINKGLLGFFLSKMKPFSA